MVNTKTKFSDFKRQLNNNKYIYLMALPVLAYYVIFHYACMYGAVIAFKDYDITKGVFNSPWVGFKHFEAFFSNVNFWRLIRNTLLISVYQLLFSFPAPILLALLLNEIRCRFFKRMVQTVTYLPHFISVVVICGLIHDFVGRTGIITDICVFFGMDRTNLLSDPRYFRTIYVASGVWQTVGWGSIVYLSALSAIDPTQYEAAIVDGAGRFRQVIHITLPGIVPTIVIMLIMRVGQVMSVGYEKIILLYNAGTYETADVISTFVYRKGLGESFQYSFTTAVGLFTSVINLILVVGSNVFSRKVSGMGLW